MATRRSGTQWSESDYKAAGYARVNLRLPADLLAELDRRAEAWGVSRTGAIRRWLETPEKPRKNGARKKAS